jgi:enoyl-CoA hydratase
MGAEALVRVERPLDGCALLTLNRPAAMNALSAAMRSELARAFEDLRDDPAARVAILTGAGRAFCAGLDLRELAAAEDGRQLATAAATDDPVRSIAAFPGPVIAAINGPAVTGGFELALACDVLLASEQAAFADTHARVGVLPSWGMSQRLQRLVGVHRAKEISLTGNFVAARQAEAWGLVNRVVPHERLLDEALQMAADMLSAVPRLLVAYKDLIDEGALLPLEQALELEGGRSRAWAEDLDLAALAAQREAVQARGRSQRQSTQRED